MMRPVRHALILCLLALSCSRAISREPVRLGGKSENARLTNMVAAHLERAGCRVERHAGDTASLDRALRANELDAYVESHQIALTQVLHRAKLPGPAAEAKVRSAYLEEDLMWTPMLGQGDLAVVFRRKIDERCRMATRALMTVAR